MFGLLRFVRLLLHELLSVWVEQVEPEFADLVEEERAGIGGAQQARLGRPPRRRSVPLLCPNKADIAPSALSVAQFTSTNGPRT